MNLNGDSAAPARADLGNWRSQPFSTWAFQHVPEIVACAVIAHDAAPVAPLPAAPRSLAGLSLAARGGATIALADFLHGTRTDGFVVMQRGRIVHESYAHGMTARTPHILMSASKSIVGVLAGILQARGALDVDAPVTELLPEIAASAWRGATVRQLLDMRTGVVLDEREMRAYRAASNWDPLPVGEAAGDLHAFFQRPAAVAPAHGGPFSYVSANTDLLGWVIERAGGKPFATLASDLLWKPLGAEDDASLTLDREGAPRCTGGLSTTARDLARLGQLVARDGRRDGNAIVPTDWIADMSRGGDRQAWQDGEFANSFHGLPMRYRSGWYVIDGEPQTLFAMGIHGQHLFVDRANEIVIAKLSSQALAVDGPAIGQTLRAASAIRRCLLG